MSEKHGGGFSSTPANGAGDIYAAIDVFGHEENHDVSALSHLTTLRLFSKSSCSIEIARDISSNVELQIPCDAGVANT